MERDRVDDLGKVGSAKKGEASVRKNGQMKTVVSSYDSRLFRLSPKDEDTLTILSILR